MARGARTAALASALGLVLAGCSAGEGVDLAGAGEVDTEDYLEVAIAGEPDQLDPHSTSAYFSFQILENVYDTLVEPDAELEMQPALAESWEVSEDQLSWTFHLREGVTFHDGSAFTAEDVVYSYDRIIDEQLANAYRLAAVEDVVAVDEHTVRIDVSQPTPALLAAIGGYKGMAIVERGNVESGDVQLDPVGTGPFEVVGNAASTAVTLRANEDYWGEGPHVPGVVYRFISEGTTALADLTAGEVHWTDSIPPQRVESLRRNPDVEVASVPSTDYWYLTMNQARPPFDSRDARRAVAQALDREALAQVTWYGSATVNQTAVPETSVWYHEYAPFEQDLDRARELAESSGLTGRTVGLMVTNEHPETVTAAQVVAANLAEIGVATEIRTLDFATWLDEQARGNFDMLLLGWLGNVDVNDYYYNQHHSEGSNNAQGYSSPEVDRLLDAGRTETDPEARKELYDRAAERIVDDASYVYLYNPDVVQAWAPELEGYEPRPDRAVRFKDVRLEEGTG
ncbi:ABC transporter substrate-binding protein [Kocuria flava]|uniref:ABC transporter substrate-binding protein n=1 Tax=Kocuria flava TaxID=446860 RepID=A0A0U3HWL7_9MICC|nr:ABC transporter substrate-binding protein [Kocuria flava]ALU39287.1 ABC transporter substrate-binding protein [Kocuria flava]GEO92144.1 ABC transporter substrate-binding protein [Kocuria flava]